MILVGGLSRRQRLEPLDHRARVGPLGALEAQPRVLLAQEHQLGLDALHVAGIGAGATSDRAEAPKWLRPLSLRGIDVIHHELGFRSVRE